MIKKISYFHLRRFDQDNMRYFIYATLILFFLGCATQPAVPKKRVTKKVIRNDRIVYRNLAPMPIAKAAVVVDSKSQSISKGNTLPKTSNEDLNNIINDALDSYPAYFIEFSNESTTIRNRGDLNDFLVKISPDDNVFVVGHSHGKSTVGNPKLAMGRVNVVEKILRKRGIKNVYMMAAWGDEHLSFTPSKGVHIYVFKNFSGKHIPLVLSHDGVKDTLFDSKMEEIP